MLDLYATYFTESESRVGDSLSLLLVMVFLQVFAVGSTVAFRNNSSKML